MPTCTDSVETCIYLVGYFVLMPLAGLLAISLPFVQRGERAAGCVSVPLGVGAILVGIYEGVQLLGC